MDMNMRSVSQVFRGLSADNEFESFEDFCEWSEQFDIKKGFTVYKRDTSKPHSKENTYWYYADKKAEEYTSPICENCEEDFLICNLNGCHKYRAWFVKNWDKNICHRPSQQEDPKARRVFVYEHPDLVREGITWKGKEES